MSNPDIELKFSTYRITGILSVFNKVVAAVSNWGKQIVTEDNGMEEFEFWCPERRPEGLNIAMKIYPAIKDFGAENLRNTVTRPVYKPNAWVASLEDKNASLTIEWDSDREINEITLFADSDFDHPMESVQWGHFDNRMPFCVDEILVYNEKMNSWHKNPTIIKLVFHSNSKKNTHQKLIIRLSNSSENVPVSLFGYTLSDNPKTFYFKNKLIKSHKRHE